MSRLRYSWIVVRSGVGIRIYVSFAHNSLVYDFGDTFI